VEAATQHKLGPFINFEVTSADGTTVVVGMKKSIVTRERSKGKWHRGDAEDLGCMPYTTVVPHTLLLCQCSPSHISYIQ
jgi:hypothetical protein